VTVILTRWALICAKTDAVVPEHSSGLSWIEPVDMTHETGVKLYKTERAAKNALAQWRRGQHRAERRRASNIFADEDDRVDIVVTPVARRLLFQFRPVPIRIEVPVCYGP
jgi:hypothetical protein